MCASKVIGILKLNTNFPRLKGDVGNPDSFDYPVVYSTIKNAVPGNVTVADELPASLQSEILACAQYLIKKQVSVITTSCGFLSTLQIQLARLSSTPVICSSLELLPLLKSVHGGADRIGVLTFNKESLNHIHTAGVTPGFIEGLLPTDTLRKVISEDSDSLNEKAALDNALAASQRLLDRAPQTQAIVLECTNLSPYKQAIREQTDLPVYDIVDAVQWLLEARGAGD